MLGVSILRDTHNTHTYTCIYIYTYIYIYIYIIINPNVSSGLEHADLSFVSRKTAVAVHCSPLFAVHHRYRSIDVAWL